MGGVVQVQPPPSQAECDGGEQCSNRRCPNPTGRARSREGAVSNAQVRETARMADVWTEDQGSPSLIDRFRDVGPAGIILGILVLGAIIAVVISASSGVEETAGEDLPVETTASTEATVAAEEPADPVDPPSGADTELREGPT